MKRFGLAAVVAILLLTVGHASAQSASGEGAAPLVPTNIPAAPHNVSKPAADTAPQGMILDRVVASVNDEAITLSEVQEDGQPVIRKIFQDFVGTERERQVEEAEKKVLDDLIDRRLMYQVAKREGTLPSSAEVQGAIDELKRNNNIKDDAQFRASLRAEGLTLEQIQRSIGERLAIGRLLAHQVRSSIIISEDEVKKYYEAHQDKFARTPSVHIQHILIAVTPDTDEAKAKARGEEALAKIRAGQDFAKVAQEYSDSPTKDRGGDLGIVHRGDLAAEIESAAFGLPVGGVSGLIRTAAGWNIIKVEAVHLETVAPLAEVRDTIRDEIFREKFEAKRKDWLAELRSQASIHIMVEKGTLMGAAKKTP